MVLPVVTQLRRKTLYTPPQDVKITDADLGPEGDLLVVQRHPDGRREAVFSGKTNERPALGLPSNADYARLMPKGRVLAMSIRTNKDNGRVFGPDNREERVFDLDAPVCEAFVDRRDGDFWVAYFQIGVSIGLSGEGLVRFDATGRPTVKFRSEFTGPESAGDLHPFCPGAGTTLWLFPEPDYALLEIDWNRWKIRSRRVPYDCHGADAIRPGGRTVYMAGSRQHPHTVFAYRIDGETAEEIGKVQGRPRPVTNRRGLFLDIQPGEVALLGLE